MSQESIFIQFPQCVKGESSHSARLRWRTCALNVYVCVCACRGSMQNAPNSAGVIAGYPVGTAKQVCITPYPQSHILNPRHN